MVEMEKTLELWGVLMRISLERTPIATRVARLATCAGHPRTRCSTSLMLFTKLSIFGMNFEPTSNQF